MHIRVKATPGARRESVTLGRDGMLSISVKEPAEGNRATNRVKELVATHCNVPVGAVRLIRGHHHRSKLFAIMKT